MSRDRVLYFLGRWRDKTAFFIFTVLIGASGVIAQVLILRELLVSFYGNELTLGMILANWLICEALGAFLIGRFARRFKNKSGALIVLQVLFLASLLAGVYFTRVFKVYLGINAGEALSLNLVFWISLLAILPAAFCHGGLFSLICAQGNVGRVYALEIIGTMAGGIALTYLLIPRLTSFRIAYLIAWLNITICFIFFKAAPRSFKYLTLGAFVAITLLFFSGGADKINNLSLAKQWQTGKLLDYRNSVYGNIALTQKEGERTFFYNGTPVITVPYPDITFVREFGNIPLLLHPNPRHILMIGAGAGGLIDEILRHPVAKVDYLELDPLLIRMLRCYPSDLTERELKDKRVNTIYRDGRLFVRETSSKYDVILIGLSRPQDLSVNRLFTREFFSLAEQRLDPGGILAVSLPGSLTYLSRELVNLNATVIGGLREVYDYLRIIPGDYNLILASNADISKVDSAAILGRLRQGRMRIEAFSPDYLDYRLDPGKEDWLKRSLAQSNVKPNRDLRPLAVFQMLIFWNKQFSTVLARVLECAGGLNLWIITAAIIFLTLLWYYLFRRRGDRVKAGLAYAIFTSGFFAMLMNLILIFGFQVCYGYLYQMLGLFIGVLMGGIAAGSLFMTRGKARFKDGLEVFRRLEAAVVIFSLLAALLMQNLGIFNTSLIWVFLCLFFITGALVGMEFPLAVTIYGVKGGGTSGTAGILYACDLLGGWLAGMLGGVILIPILGVLNSCIVLAIWKLASLLLLKTF